MNHLLRMVSFLFALGLSMLALAVPASVEAASGDGTQQERREHSPEQGSRDTAAAGSRTSSSKGDPSALASARPRRESIVSRGGTILSESSDSYAVVSAAFQLLADDRPAEAAAILGRTLTNIEDPELFIAATALFDLAEARRTRALQNPPLLLGSIESEGRFATLAWTTVGSIAAGINLGAMLELQDPRTNVLVAMTTTGAGLGAAILATRNTPIMPSTASLYGTSMIAGGLMAWQIGHLAEMSPASVSGLMIAGSVGGGMLGYWAGHKSEISPGSAALVRSTLLWGSVIGMLVLPTVQPAEDRVRHGVLLGGSAAGLAVGAIAAGMVDITRSRVLLMDLGALVGGLAFGGLGIAVLDDKPAALSPMFVPPLAIVGVLAGSAVSLLLTRDLDLAPDGPGDVRGVTAMLERSGDGWSAGAPSLSIMPSTSTRVGNAVGVTLLGGEF